MSVDAAPDLHHPEFDWFGLDRTGQYAIFATAGTGPVPMAVRAAAEAHDELRAAIAVPGVRSPDFPRSYARVGLFVYEWSKAAGDYRLAAPPTHALLASLRVQLAACREVPVLDVDDFGEAATIGSNAWILKRGAARRADIAGHDTCPKCRRRFATRSAVVDMGAETGLVSDSQLTATYVQCPHCQHRFRAMSTRYLGIFDAAQMRIVLLGLAALGVGAIALVLSLD